MKCKTWGNPPRKPAENGKGYENLNQRNYAGQGLVKDEIEVSTLHQYAGWLRIEIEPVQSICRLSAYSDTDEMIKGVAQAANQATVD